MNQICPPASVIRQLIQQKTAVNSGIRVFENKIKHVYSKKCDRNGRCCFYRLLHLIINFSIILLSFPIFSKCYTTNIKTSTTSKLPVIFFLLIHLFQLLISDGRSADWAKGMVTLIENEQYQDLVTMLDKTVNRLEALKS